MQIIKFKKYNRYNHKKNTIGMNRTFRSIIHIITFLIIRIILFGNIQIKYVIVLHLYIPYNPKKSTIRIIKILIVPIILLIIQVIFLCDYTDYTFLNFIILIIRIICNYTDNIHLHVQSV